MQNRDDQSLPLTEPAQQAAPPETVSFAGASSRPNADPPNRDEKQDRPGELFGNYELLEVIGKGGMGVVYRARQLGLNRIVALKRIRAGELAEGDQIQRFYAEAEAAASLDHAGIVPIYEVGQVGGLPFFSMGFVAGESLQHRLLPGPLEPAEAARVVREVAIAVEYAHQQGIIHRDLKPANILLHADGHALVSDFGLAKRILSDSGLTMTGQLLGTPAYMPPEQARGEHDRIGPRADVYALGAVLYAALSGRPPFQAAAVSEVLRQVIDAEPVAVRTLNPSIPVDLESITLKCLNKDPARRYASAGDLAADLQRWQNGFSIIARPVSQLERLARWAKRNRVLAGLLGLSALLLVMISIISVAAFLRADSDARANAKMAFEKTKLAEKEGKALRDVQKQLRISTANRLAAQAISQVNDRPVLALLLAAAAAESTSLPGEAVTPSAMASLRDVLAKAGGFPLTGHSSGLTSLALSPDGRWLVTGSHDATTRVWDLRSADPSASSYALRGHQHNVSNVQISPGGRWLMSRGDNVTTCLWDLQTITPDAKPRTFTLSQSGAIAFSPDERWLALQQCEIWDLNAERPDAEPRQLQGKNLGQLQGLVFSLDGRFVYGVNGGPGVCVWDLQKTEPQPRRLPGEGQVYTLTLSPNGQSLAAIGYVANSPAIFIWNLRDLESTPRPIVVRCNASRALTFSADSRWLVNGGRDMVARIWDLHSADPAASVRVLQGHEGVINCVNISPDGRWLATGSADQTIRVWNLQSPDPGLNPRVFRGHEGEISNLALSPDSRWLYSVAVRDKVARMWDLQAASNAANPQCVADQLQMSKGVALSNDGRWLVAQRDRNAFVWDLQSPDAPANPQTPSFDHNYEGVGFFAISPDNQRLVTLMGNDTAAVWNLASLNERQRSLSGAKGIVINSAISPDGRWFLTTNESSGETNLVNIVRMWDLQSREPSVIPRRLHGPGRIVACQAFSADGRWFVIGTDDRMIRVWDLHAP